MSPGLKRVFRNSISPRPDLIDAMSEAEAETLTTSTTSRGHRKERIGEVVSNKMEKTIIVRVERRLPHPRYRKVVTSFSKFFAHDEKQEANVGDHVRIRETRPLSKNKCWRLVEVVTKNPDASAVAR